MKKIGITGQEGFIGSHLYNTLGLTPKKYTIIDFDNTSFDDENKLDAFVSQCDVIVHLAALNRHEDENVIYNTNIKLVQQLIDSLKKNNSKAHLLMSSSSQEDRENLYGKSKKEGREMLWQWAQSENALFTGLIIPNVFGPFGAPFYNSVIATFCHQISHGETPKIQVDGEVNLIYVGELVNEIIGAIEQGINESYYKIQYTHTAKVSEIMNLLLSYKELYQDRGEVPAINNNFELNLFNTYRCYMDIKNHFPVKFIKNTDPRGSFVEIIRLGIGGQVSFSTTVPGITRGNHFHTRKIERFAVIKGKALIEMRRIGTSEMLSFELDGDEPAYVDMPIWYTHNIKNIGEEILYTNFWINEPYNAEDPDTYFVEV